MTIGIIIVVIVLLVFAYFVYVDMRRKKRSKAAPKESFWERQKKKRAEKKENRAPKEKKEKQPKEKKQKERKKKEDTDSIPNYDALELDGKESENSNGFEGNNDALRFEPSKDYIKNQMDSVFNGENKQKEKRDGFTTRSGVDLLSGLGFEGDKRKKGHREIRDASSRSTIDSYYNNNYEYDDDMISNKNTSDLATMLDSMPPEIKVLLTTNILDPRDDV